MTKTHIAMALMAFIFAACSPGRAEPTPTVAAVPARPTATPPPSATPRGVATAATEAAPRGQGSPLPVFRGDFFSTSGVCASCHQGMVDDSGADVSIDSAWRSSMMANAARDPYWQASLRAELLHFPEAGTSIEETCARCHMPMAVFSAAVKGEGVEVLDGGAIDPEHPLHPLAIDGVSCTLCHQVRETGFGLRESFNGGFDIDTELAAGKRVVYGQYGVEEDQASIMEAGSGFVPLQGQHISRSELCATCHTLYIPTFDDRGEVVGEFPEQMPYFEWWYSDYRRTRTCQDCHMPEAEGGVRIATTSDFPRSPFSQHIFVGGNAYMLEVLETFGDLLGVTASPEQFEATRERTLEQLQSRTASVTIEEASRSARRLTVDVAVESQVGHKFPTGFPSRRAWLHFSVRDSTGQVIFESGGVNPDGSIVGNDNDLDPGQFEPHYLAIVQPDQVQIYEAILRDTNGKVTTDLLRASGYLKDSRLLPAGFEKDAPIEEIVVRGRAFEDVDFLGGGDRIQYVVDLGQAQGPFSVVVELLYQSIGYRWLENLRRDDAPEIARFLGFVEAVPNLPVVVSADSTEVTGP